MLERYQPRKTSLRDKQKQSLQPKTQDYSSLLQAQILGAQKRRLQKQIQEAQRNIKNQVEPTGFTEIAERESQMPAGGSAAELGIQTTPEVDTRRSTFNALGDYLKRQSAFGAGLVGKVAAEKIPFTKGKRWFNKYCRRTR